MANEETTPEGETPEDKVENSPQGETTPEQTPASSGAEGEEKVDSKKLSELVGNLTKEIKEERKARGESSKEAKRLAAKLKEKEEAEEQKKEEEEEEKNKALQPPTDYTHKEPEEILKAVEEKTTVAVLKTIEDKNKQTAKDKAEAEKIILDASGDYPLLKKSKRYRRIVANMMDAEGIPIEEACDKVNGFMEKVKKDEIGKSKKESQVEGAAGSGSTPENESVGKKIKESLKASRSTSELQGL